MHCADTSVKTWVSMKDSLRFVARYRSGLDTYEETQNTSDGQQKVLLGMSLWSFDVECDNFLNVFDGMLRLSKG